MQNSVFTFKRCTRTSICEYVLRKCHNLYLQDDDDNQDYLFTEQYVRSRSNRCTDRTKRNPEVH